MEIEITLLSENKEFVKAVSQMVYKEFVLPSSSKMSFDDVVDFFSDTYSSKFPITFIAILDHQCVGTVSIFENDFKKCTHFKPWLASLYVDPNYRERKIGISLIDALLKHLVSLGFREVYLKTENAAEYYLNRGWEFVESVLDDRNVNLDIFKHNLINKKLRTK
ncbi:MULTISPECIES: GNAT family N-acetyltransferase [unclassified Rummeliibacillus]|uniref:GNAT family N-acetyltransferase n=1 Tax=unclassified Rummeliibacillus TaxID=2622809 RepID=UPI001F3A5E39|nr:MULTISPECIES: GNAT family N-acetyltransferase [unclassified Rummeliibacillus]